MSPELVAQFTAFTDTLPCSRMVYPTSFLNKLKYIFWRLYTPYHPFWRDLLLALGILSHEGRQNFLLGRVAPGESIKSLVTFLISRGYGNHFIAWKDEGEVIGLRYVDNFTYQYHIRIFKDGEVRGHYEYTPECHPVWHFKEVRMEDRRAEFLSLLGDRIVPRAQ